MNLKGASEACEKGLKGGSSKGWRSLEIGKIVNLNLTDTGPVYVKIAIDDKFKFTYGG